MATFHIYRRDDTYRWRLRSDHQSVVAFGVGQPTVQHAIRDIEAMKLMIADAPITMDEPGGPVRTAATSPS